MGDIFANLLSSSVVLGLVRSGATAAGGWLVASGLIDASQQQVVIGAIIGLGGVALSAASNAIKHRNKKVLEAVDQKAPIALAEAAAAVGTTSAKVVK